MSDELKRWIRAAGYVVRNQHDHADTDETQVSTHATRESVEALQEAWDKNESDLQTKMPIRPGPMNWPTDLLLMDSLRFADWKWLHAFLSATAGDVAAEREACALAASIHGCYPIETDWERGYDAGRREAAAAIRARGHGVAEERWLAIETAPKDGTLVWIGRADGYMVLARNWGGAWFRDSGTYAGECTHWMPFHMPAPPPSAAAVSTEIADGSCQTCHGTRRVHLAGATGPIPCPTCWYVVPDKATLHKMRDDIAAAIRARGPGVVGDLDRLREALEEVIGCFEAAGAEGLIERLSELPDVSAGSLHDLFFRRILHAEHAARRAVEAYRAAAGSTGAK